MDPPDPEIFPPLPPEPPEPPERTPGIVYSVPRRYDLATMFVVSTAYAVLFAGMRMLEWPMEMSLTTGLFITLVGLGQALLFGGKSPRLASVVVGYAFGVGGYLFIVWEDAGYVPAEYFFGSLLVGLWWLPLGYLAGVLIGSVFMAAEKLRGGVR